MLALAIGLMFLLSETALAGDDLTKLLKGQPLERVLARKDVGSLPFAARDQLLLDVVPEYKAFHPADAFNVLRQYEEMQSSSAGLKPLREFIWFEGCRDCGSFFGKGKQFLTVNYGPLTLAVSAGEFEKYIGAWISASLAPDSNITVDVLTRNASFAEIRPRVSAYELVPFKEVAKTVQHGAGWKAALVSGLGGMATRTVVVEQEGEFRGSYNRSDGLGTFSGNYSGRSTVQVPDLEARANARARANQLIQAAEARAAGIFNTALLDTTLAPGRSVDGFVYFRKDKGMKTGVLQLKVGTVSFEFPLEWR